MSTDLERRIAELSEEIRNYPTPIARCDEQLTALLEERARLLNELKKHDGDVNAA
jgi:chorismate mutase